MLKIINRDSDYWVIYRLRLAFKYSSTGGRFIYDLRLFKQARSSVGFSTKSIVFPSFTTFSN